MGENKETVKAADAQKPPEMGFVFTSFRDFLKFVEYVADAAPLEFAAPVLDTSGAALIQKSLQFREGMLKNLWKFFNQGNLNENIIIADTKALRTALRDKICRSLFKCLESGRFHIAQALSDASRINLRQMVAGIIERRDVLLLFLKLDQMGDPLLPHLGEVALVAGGFAEQYVRQSGDDKYARESIRTAMFAGLLHDFALIDDDDFLAKDIERIEESGHAGKSAELIKTLLPGVDEKILAAVENHHRSKILYHPDEEKKLPPDLIALESLALSEYIFVQLRSQYRKDESMSSAELLFFDLGRAFGQGMFHPHFKKIASSLWENLYTTLAYGYEIGAIESSCPHRPSAIAYPSPRCTQIMCSDNVTACRYFQSHFPLEIFQPVRHPAKPGQLIMAGKYHKCKLAENLPKGLSEKENAAQWMAKGKTGDVWLKPGEL